VEVSEDCLSFYKADGTLAAVLTSQLFAVGAKCMNPNFRQTEQDGLDWSGQRLGSNAVTGEVLEAKLPISRLYIQVTLIAPAGTS
jgi:hypothetical protein